MSEPAIPVLLCFDGSIDADHAISTAGVLLGPRPAIVITVSEPIRLWEADDPATILDAPIGKLLSKALNIEEIAAEVAGEQASRGLEIARAAGFDAQSRVVRGKAWRVICDVAQDIDAAVIVLGARGLSRVQSALLGSVSSTVSVHAGRPVLIIPPRSSLAACSRPASDVRRSTRPAAPAGRPASPP